MGYQPPIQFDRQKFKEVVLYICQKAARDRLGGVKLHKTLYYADMVQFAFTGRPITGSRYRKRPFGPTSDDLLPALRALVNEGALRIETENYYGYRKNVYVSLREPDLAGIPEDELALINESLDFVCNKNSAKTISEFSHNDAWEMAIMGEELPYHTAFSLFPTQVSLEAMEWAASVVPEIEAARSESPPAVGHESFEAFRSRLRKTSG